MKNKGLVFRFVSEDLQNDSGIVLEAANNVVCSFALCFASKDLKKDRKIVLKTIKNDGCLASMLFSKNLQIDIEIVLKACYDRE